MFICMHTFDVLSGPLPNSGDSFIVADSHLKNIYQVDASSGATAQLLPIDGALNPVALAYDPTTSSLYWSDLNAYTINKYSLLTNSSAVIYGYPYMTSKCNK